MKKLLLIFTLLFSVMFSSTSWAEWKLIVTSVNGNNIYVEPDTIKKVGNLSYFWRLFDYVKPNEYGDLSSEAYIEVDCKNLNYRFLSTKFYTSPLGKGEPSSVDTKPDKDWRIIVKDSIAYIAHNFVCNYKK